MNNENMTITFTFERKLTNLIDLNPINKFHIFDGGNGKITVVCDFTYLTFVHEFMKFIARKNNTRLINVIVKTIHMDSVTQACIITARNYRSSSNPDFIPTHNFIKAKI